MSAAHWEIVGGADKGGVLVRTGLKLDSEACSERLGTGSLVEEVDLDGERLHYSLLKGTGPAEGWISIKIKGKELAVEVKPWGAVVPKGEIFGHQLSEEREEMWPSWKAGVELSVRLAMPIAVGKDPDYSKLVSVQRTEIVDDMRSADSTKVPCCAIFICGMPQFHYGNARSTDPFPNAIMENCWKIGLPTVRFDYSGYGNSTGEEIVLGDTTTMGKDFQHVLERVLGEYSQTVAILAFSAGNLTAGIPVMNKTLFKDKLCAYVNINMGHRSQAMVAENSQELLKMPPDEYLGKSVDLAAKLGHVPHLYIRADKDWMTPDVDIRFLMERQAKAAGGKNKADYKTFPGKHAFEGGKEVAPAEAIAEFLQEVLPPK